MADKSLIEQAEVWLRKADESDLGRHLLAALLIVVGAFLLARLVRLAFERLRKRFLSASAVLYIFEQLLGYLIIVLGLLVAVARLGIDLSALAVFGGALGVGVGLGLQGIVKEFVSGIVLIFDPAVRVGDFVELKEGVRGEVVEIGPRASRLRTNDDLNVIIPNSSLVQDQVINWTFNDASRRIHVPFSVGKESDVAVVREVVLEAARALSFTQPEDRLHKTQVWLTAFAGSGLEFDLVVWPTTESARHPRTMHAAYTWAIYHALRDAGLTLASPELDLRLQSLFGREGDAALKALDLERTRHAPPHADHPTPPNDAAQAMIDDAARAQAKREEEARDHGGRHHADAQ